jgi:selenocysteine-specific elongation factor
MRVHVIRGKLSGMAANTRKNIMLGTAGHVDHGKTAVVKILTGCNTDSLAEEQKRGLTIDLGFAPCKMADERIVGVIDVPGHVDFIRNMVAGAHGIDVVIFVVAADDGVMPQTREHLDILTLMGTRGGIVALTKIDLVASDMRDLAIEDVRGLLAGTFLADAPICPVSNITGEGYDGLLAALNAAVAACPERSVTGCFRVWVEDVYTIHGFGTVATGIPVSGQVAVGDHLRLLPGGQEVRVRTLEVYGQDAQVGRAGECVAMNLSGVEGGQIARGMVLCESSSLAPVTMAEAQLRLLPHFPRPLKDYTEVHLHVGTAETTAHVAMLEAKFLDPGAYAMVQLRLREPMGLAAGDRFAIRADLGGPTAGRLTTIGGGRIVSMSNIRLRRNRPWTLAALAERCEAMDDPARWCEVNLKQSPAPLAPTELAAIAHVKLAEAQAVVAELFKSARAADASGGRVLHAQQVAALGARLTEELEKFHAANPSRLGAELDQLARDLQMDKALLDLAASALLRSGALQKQGSVLRIKGRGANLSNADVALCEKIEAAMKAAALAPPFTADLAAALQADEPRAAKLLALLADQGAIVKLDYKLCMHRDAVEQAKRVALDLFAKAGAFETVQFRDALGVSRKFAVPLLDYFDTIRWTVRGGSRRTPGAAAKEALAKIVERGE